MVRTASAAAAAASAAAATVAAAAAAAWDTSLKEFEVLPSRKL